MLKNYKHYAATGKMAAVFTALILFFFVLSSLAASEENCTKIIVDLGDRNNPYSTSEGPDSLTDREGLDISGEAAASALPDTARYVIMGLAGIVASIIGILGIILLYKNYGAFLASSESGDEQKDDAAKSDYLMRKTVGMILGIVMVLSCVWMLLYFFNMQIGDQPSDTAGLLSLILPVLLAILVFGAVLLMCAMHARLKDQEVGSMRKTIAGLLVLGLIVVVFSSLFGGIQDKDKDIVTQYIQLVGVIIAFYFGSRVAGTAGENAAGILRNLPAGAPGQNPPAQGDESGLGEEGQNKNVGNGKESDVPGQDKDQNAGAV